MVGNFPKQIIDPTIEDKICYKDGKPEKMGLSKAEFREARAAFCQKFTEIDSFEHLNEQIRSNPTDPRFRGCHGVEIGSELIGHLDAAAKEGQSALLSRQAAYPVYEDADVAVFVPFGDHMSMVHLICVPKRGIYNAVTLDPTDVSLLRKMRNQSIEQVFKVLTSKGGRVQYTDFLERGLNEGRIRIARAEDDVDSAKSSNHQVLLHQMKSNMTQFARMGCVRSNISCTLQVHPHAKVGQLHMHAFIPHKELITSYGRRSVHTHTPVERIIKVLSD